MKTKEELFELKEEYQSLTRKLQELTDDELKIVTGGFDFEVPNDMEQQYEFHFYKNPTSPMNPFQKNEG